MPAYLAIDRHTGTDDGDSGYNQQAIEHAYEHDSTRIPDLAAKALFLDD